MTRAEEVNVGEDKKVPAVKVGEAPLSPSTRLVVCLHTVI